ncbi:MAG: deoxynucleoside kinase [Gammaproteobacteria bacterium SHHR-1]|uniref:deoxynucleoside kinase n=1 Tax=Magnetovirga frankeli TaxID=947516 RepID=UPI001292E914|nr:deoxynucleoside kinase [gamma proteobacterium SS-5]
MSTEKLQRLGFVVVEGAIGVGKTSFAQRLADHLGSDTLFEAPEENPFLERFYQEKCNLALPTQLYFLFQRSRQIQALMEGDLFRSRLVADFMLDKDPLFARVNLDGDELELYQQVFTNMRLESPRPDLVIYLQAPVECLLERIKRRNRPSEGNMDADYLQRLSDAYSEFFYHYDRSPLLIVNTEGLNLAEGEEDFNLLMQRIIECEYGRHYFNPMPLLTA